MSHRYKSIRQRKLDIIDSITKDSHPIVEEMITNKRKIQLKDVEKPRHDKSSKCALFEVNMLLYSNLCFLDYSQKFRRSGKETTLQRAGRTGTTDRERENHSIP